MSWECYWCLPSQDHQIQFRIGNRIWNLENNHCKHFFSHFFHTVLKRRNFRRWKFSYFSFQNLRIEFIFVLPWPKKSLQPRNSWGWSDSLIMWNRAISSLGSTSTRPAALRVASSHTDWSRSRMISHDCSADQSHEYLGCNDFFGQGSTFGWPRKIQLGKIEKLARPRKKFWYGI